MTVNKSVLPATNTYYHFNEYCIIAIANYYLDVISVISQIAIANSYCQ